MIFFRSRTLLPPFFYDSGSAGVVTSGVTDSGAAVVVSFVVGCAVVVSGAAVVVSFVVGWVVGCVGASVAGS